MKIGASLSTRRYHGKLWYLLRVTNSLQKNRLKLWILYIMGNTLAKFGWFLYIYQGSFLYFLEHLNNDSEKWLPIFARYFRKAHVNLSFQPSVLQGSRFVWSLALPVIVIAPFSVFQKMNRNANLFIYNIRRLSFFKISWEVYCVIFTMFVPWNHFLLSRFSYHLELGVDH